jgi:F-type H+-transporting ATPase subunit epsilon
VSLDLVIVTPEGEVFSGVVEQVVLPGSEGDFGVLEQHERTLAPLQHGVVEIKTTSGSEWAAVSNGFADVSAERVVVLADSCVLAGKIDKAAVEAALRDAQAELGGLAELEANAQQREDLSETIRKHEAQLSAVASQ